MIGRVSLVGDREAGPLLEYLFGADETRQHTGSRIVAAWQPPGEIEPPTRASGEQDVRRLAGLLMQPYRALSEADRSQPVWHCTVFAAPGDRELTDAEWAEICRDIMHCTGLAPRGQDLEAVRWVAIRDTGDHVHLVAVLARQDGGKPQTRNHAHRIREACQAAERQNGLTITVLQKCQWPTDVTGTGFPSAPTAAPLPVPAREARRRRPDPGHPRSASTT